MEIMKQIRSSIHFYRSTYLFGEFLFPVHMEKLFFNSLLSVHLVRRIDKQKTFICLNINFDEHITLIPLIFIEKIKWNRKLC